MILTKAAGIEATAVLATDFRADLETAGVDGDTIDRAVEFFDEISVLPESVALAPVATAMHDPTEGGVLNGLVELACASGVRIDLQAGVVPVRPETRTLCAAMGVDPLRVLGSGALLATVPGDEAEQAVAALDEAGIDGRVVATVEASADEDDAGVVSDGQHYAGGVRDEMYDLWG